MMTPSDKLRLQTLKLNLGHRRCYCLQYLGEGWIEWECKQGHCFRKRMKRWQSIEQGLRKLTEPGGYWSKQGGGCAVLCPKCWEEAQRLFNKERKS